MTTSLLLAAMQIATAGISRPVIRAADTTIVVDTVALREAARPAVAAPRVAFDFGNGLSAPVAARTFEITVNGAPSAPAGARARAVSAVPAAQLRIVRSPDSLSTELARRAVEGARLPEVTIQLPAENAAAGVTVHLYDVQVMSSRLQSNHDDAPLRERQLSLDEAIDQLGVDLDEAQRQLAVIESLRKREMSSSLELARARASVAVLTRKIGIQRERLALLNAELSRWTPVQEESILAAGRVVIDER
ncbi:MAG: hypothetical protein HOQ09_06860 [Gemmatimonadaceae bacterium]|nr:hypothetical protein [Gemmatimonadaceae bacterium]